MLLLRTSDEDLHSSTTNGIKRSFVTNTILSSSGYKTESTHKRVIVKLLSFTPHKMQQLLKKESSCPHYWGPSYGFSTAHFFHKINRNTCVFKNRHDLPNCCLEKTQPQFSGASTWNTIFSTEYQTCCWHFHCSAARLAMHSLVPLEF